ncbi:MAG: hypothetical protein RSC98_10525, partial [Clostridia bacterium]
MEPLNTQGQQEWSQFAGAQRTLALEANMLQRLQRPQGAVDVVLDTDTFNEIDGLSLKANVCYARLSSLLL